tara:strand:+ start:740 stop:1054 length:315 start_codon:yes stop_codon:yes gene_type:complete
MATVNATTQAGGVANFASGSFTSDNTATVVTLGFKPRCIKVINSTDVIVWEKIEGMAAANSVKTTSSGTTTVDTGSAVLIADLSFTISATAAGSSKAISWIAIA